MNLHIYSAIKGYKKRSPKRFHMPGHKGKNVLKTDFSYDVTELPAIDNEVAIKNAEKDAEKIYGAKKVKFLSDGATAGILSALYAVSLKTEKIIINKDAHKSVYNALTLLKKTPVIIGGVYSDNTAKPLTVEELKAAVTANPSAKVACLTYPDYYGKTFDINSVSAFFKERGIILIIDGAHGGLMRYTSPSVYGGKYADILVESAHKTFPTLNQGALIICYNDDLADGIEEGVNVFCTTSPSYPILSSVEYGIKYFELNPEKIKKSVRKISLLRKTLEDSGIEVLGTEDVFKLTVIIKGQAEKIALALEKKGIFSELYNKNRILFMLSPFNRKGEIRKLKKELIKQIKNSPPIKAVKKEKEELVLTRAVNYLAAVTGEKEEIELKDACGRICAVNAGLFPPCFPLITAGEVIDERIIEILSEEKGVFGLKDGRISVIKEKD